ncbi:hypothetical protein Dgeo_2082 [Deinococcus geothermalis DSM 11300]|uniref:Uncharacterized protein n=2 Tax=Deinococcaceae TaxID=183710 RepID=Q1IWK8_DEIGD|nr:hypothetical protein Dgeo_2082 [Deinococcus geothermalis DSM 11300]
MSGRGLPCSQPQSAAVGGILTRWAYAPLGMKALRAALLTLLVLGGAAVTSTPVGAASSVENLPAGWQSKLAALVPQPGQLVQLMERRSSLAFVELQQRVAMAGGSRDALRAVMLSVAKGEAPTYDERLGISRQEFQQYVVFQPTLVATGRSLKLPLTRDGNRLKFGDAPGLNGVLRGLVLDLGTGELRTPEGFGTRPRAVVPSTAPDRTLDIRGGFEWTVKGNSPVTQNGISGQLQILQLGGSQVILSYSRLSMLHGTIDQGGVILGYTR